MKTRSGQTLILLLVFTAMAMIVISAAVFLTVSNIQTGNSQELSNSALDIAESGAENALLLLLRNPTYPGGTLTVGDQIATIVVTGTGPYIINSVGQTGSYTRSVRVTADYVNGILTVSGWQEIYP